MILIISDKETYKEKVQTVLKRLHEADQVIKINAVPVVTFFGHVVTREGIAPDPKRVMSIREFPQPKVVKELSRSLDVVNIYRTNIPQAAVYQRHLREHRLFQ